MSGGTATYQVTGYADSDAFFEELMSAAAQEAAITFETFVTDSIVTAMIKEGMMEEAARKRTFTVTVREVYLGGKRRALVVDEDGMPILIHLPSTGPSVFSIFS